MPPILSIMLQHAVHEQAKQYYWQVTTWSTLDHASVTSIIHIHML